MITQVPLVSLVRDGFEEVTVHGEIVIADEVGRYWSASEGVGRYPVRSVLKPFQFLACGLPAERWRGSSLVSSRYAPCVGSISATVDQIQVMDAWYRKGKPNSLLGLIQVPPGFPLDAEKRVQSYARGPKQIYHTCFSKHAAIVEACDHHGWDPATYLTRAHPFHQRLVGLLSDFLGRDVGAGEFVTDGCQLPSPVLTLTDTARLYQRFASAGEEEELGWVRRLMAANPEWVGGPGRIDTLLMQSNPGKLVAKEGADGLLAIGLLPNGAFPKGLGVVIKLACGFDMKSAALALAPVLESLGLRTVHESPSGVKAHWWQEPLKLNRRPFIDISPRVGPETAVWPGDKAFSRDVSLDTLKGSHLTLSSISTTVHVGAHTDAPNHFQASDRGIDTVDIARYTGPCQVLMVAKLPGERIYPADIAVREIRAARILFKTGSFPNPNQFNSDFVSLSGELIDWLAARGVQLVGIDTPSIDAFDSKDLPAHLATLRTGMAILEGIVLDHAVEGLYELIALPLKLASADASPVRAILRR